MLSCRNKTGSTFSHWSKKKRKTTQTCLQYSTVLSSTQQYSTVHITTLHTHTSTTQRLKTTSNSMWMQWWHEQNKQETHTVSVKSTTSLHRNINTHTNTHKHRSIHKLQQELKSIKIICRRREQGSAASVWCIINVNQRRETQEEETVTLAHHHTHTHSCPERARVCVCVWTEELTPFFRWL